MSKLIVKTSGDFELYDVFSGEVVTNTRPCVISPSAFFQNRVALGQLNVLADDLDDKADDAEFADVLAQAGDEVTAIAAYKAELLGLVEETPEQAADRKAAEKAARKAAKAAAAGA